MGYNELEVELRKIEALIARWRRLGYLPAIEQGIALRRLQKVYAELIEMPCGNEPEEIDIEPVAAVPPAAAAETEGVSYDGMAPDDESFEPYVPFEAPVEAEEAEEVAVVIEEEVEDTTGGISEETHVRQDDEAHDLCPPQLEFPEPDEPEPIAETKPVEKPRMQKPKPESESPRILGIEVSPYARHEIIDTLFHGNEALFEAETAKIDAMDSLEEALVYVGETYRWIPENAATIKFIDLLESRFEK